MRLLIFDDSPRISPIVLLSAIISRIMHSTSATEESLALSADMRCKLALIRHTAWVLPLGLIYTLPYRVLAQVQIERFSETDGTALLNCILDATLFIILSHLEWQVLVLSLHLRSQKVTISFDEPFLIIESLGEQVFLVLSMNSITSIFCRLIVAQIDVVRLICFDERLIIGIQA